MAKISLIVNGNPVNANIDPRTLLVQFLRENLRLTGTSVWPPAITLASSFLIRRLAA